MYERFTRSISVAACVAVLVVVFGCEEERPPAGPWCGDEVIQEGEECDGNELNGETCGSLVPGSRGELRCDLETCQYETSGCAVCGDGLVQGSEPCDCGTDGESLPQGCDDVNGGPLGDCSPTCQTKSPCSLDYGQACNPLEAGACCPDDEGVAAECFSLGTDSMCLRPCLQAGDCPWSNTCYEQFGGACYVAFCGPGVAGNDVLINSYCTVPGGGGPGWCVPMVGRDIDEDPVGLCVEAGGLTPFAPCQAGPLDMVSRLDPYCAYGVCLGSGSEAACHQFCDWQAHYQIQIYDDLSVTEALPCPAGTTCLPESTVDETTGVRSGDVALCRDIVAEDMTTCSVVSNQLLEQPGETCSTAAGFTHGRCALVNFGTAGLSWGSLVGRCVDGDPPDRAVWDGCDPSGPDVCPPGTECLEENAFSDPADGTTRCVPYCDTVRHNGVNATCQELGAQVTADGTPVCQSWSEFFRPSGSPPDVDPTRLGLCVRP